jgi:malonate decarboxylase epsilon subunit
MIAYLYPGQGAQRPGMLHSLPADRVVEAVFDAVSGVIRRDVRTLDAPAVESDTVAAQLALFTAGVACTRLLAVNGMHPDVVVGHSVGAFAAAVAAGTLTLEEGAGAVRLRAEAMRRLYPAGFGMLALSGTWLAEADRLVADTQRKGDLFVAMENAEDQVVLAGSDHAFERVRAAAPRFSVREIRRLNVAAPSHCPLMSPVADTVAQYLRAVSPRRPAVTYLSAMTARRAWAEDAVIEDLSAGVASMVRWRDTTDLLAELGTSALAQIPPGHTTAALFASAHPTVPVIALDDAPFGDSLTRLKKILQAC